METISNNKYASLSLLNKYWTINENFNDMRAVFGAYCLPSPATGIMGSKFGELVVSVLFLCLCCILSA